MPTEPTTADLLAAMQALREEVHALRSALPEQLVDLHQAAKHLGVGERTLKRWGAEDRVAYRRVGRRVLFQAVGAERAARGLEP